MYKCGFVFKKYSFTEKGAKKGEIKRTPKQKASVDFPGCSVTRRMDPLLTVCCLGIKRICEAENQPILRSLQRKSTHKDSWKPISYRLIFRNPPKYLVMYGWHTHWILVGGWTDPVWKICASQFEPFPHDIEVQNSKHLGKTTTYMKETHPDLTRESAPLRSTWLPCGTILRSQAKKQKFSRSLREEIHPFCKNA